MGHYLDTGGRLKGDFKLLEEHTFYQPERDLLVAVLQRGILDALGFGTGIMKSSVPLLTREARGWIFSRSKEPFSFVWICIELDISPAVIRKLVPDISYKKKRECDYNTIRNLANKISAGKGVGVFA